MPEHAVGKPAGILIIEDESLIAEEMADHLRALGYNVLGIADTAARAIEACRERSPDLVLMDIRLKGRMDGIEAAGAIRAHADIPIVYVTAHSDLGTLERAKPTQPYGYVLKPVMQRELHIAVELALHHHALDRRLRESEARYATTLASIGDGVIAADELGRVRFLNHTAERLTGWSAEEAIGQQAAQVFPIHRESDGALEENPIQQVLAGAAPFHLASGLALASRNGEYIPIDDAAAPIVDEARGVRGAVVTFRDARPRREAEAKWRIALDRLHRAETLETVGRLAGSVAHDFNNELSVIVSSVGALLQDAPSDSLLRRHLLEIERAGQRAAGLTRQLVMLGRRHEPEMETLDLNHLVSRLRPVLQRLVGDRVELEWEPTHVRLPVRVDRALIEQALLNLASNARDAMPAGGTLALTSARTAPEPGTGTPGGASGSGARASLTIADTGVGMDAGVSARAFELFFTTKPEGRGTGLGLANVMHAVEQCGGTIRMESAPGAGTRFELEFPLEAPGDPVDHASVEIQDLPRAQGNEHVLLVDDQASVRTVFALVLERLGYRVHAAAGADEALAMFHQAPSRIDLLLTDVRMPGTTGGQLATRLLGLRPGLGVLLVSGQHDDEDARRLAQTHGIRCLRKPFPIAELAHAVRQTLDAARGRGEDHR